MGYTKRNRLAVDDLNKLIPYKIKLGISDRWQAKAYSYLNAFRRGSGLDPVPFPSHLTEVSVSIKESNLVICQTLGITPRMVQKLDLQTLRIDANQHRKRRYNANRGRTSREGYLLNCQHHTSQLETMINALLDKGLSKTAIAEQLAISRKHVHHIIKQKEKPHEIQTHK